jgi:PPOX class probable F420-dependent enzyme
MSGNDRRGDLDHRERQDNIPEGYEDLLRSSAVAHVATIGPKGEPQVNPVWFDWDGEQLFLPVGTRQKYKSVGRDPHVALSIVDPENHLRYIEIRGQVVRVEEDPNIDFISSMAKKYLGVDRYPNHQPGDERIVLYVEPRHTTQMG